MTDLCPSCLRELPANYPYDHIEIDRAIAGDRAAFRAMGAATRAEALRVGVDRGLTLSRLAVRLGRNTTELQAIASGRPERHETEAWVIELHARQFSDGAIARALHADTTTVRKTRHRYHLPTLYGAGGYLGDRGQVAA